MDSFISDAGLISRFYLSQREPACKLASHASTCFCKQEERLPLDSSCAICGNEAAGSEGDWAKTTSYNEVNACSHL